MMEVGCITGLDSRSSSDTAGHTGILVYKPMARIIQEGGQMVCKHYLFHSVSSSSVAAIGAFCKQDL